MNKSVNLRKVDQVRGRKFETDLLPSVWEGIQNGTLKGKYKELALQKNPFDRVLYQELVQNLKPASIIEVGSFQGGSALWFSDLCTSLCLDSKLLSIDIKPPELKHKGIEFVYGDAFSPSETFPHKKIEVLPHPWLVISDSAHVYETELSVLEYFSDLMVEGDYIVVEDGVVSDFGLERYKKFEDGPNRAVADFLAVRKDFQIDEKLCDFFGHNLTYCPNGWLYKST